MAPRSYGDFKELARRRLPPFLFEYIDAGSYGEVTARRNENDLAELTLRQRVLRDVSEIDLSARMMGRKAAMPVALGPVGIAGMFSRRGEVAAARAAEAFGVPFSLSSAACCPLEEVAQGAGGDLWFQLYMLRDRGYMAALLERAAEARYRTLLITVDTPRLGVRYRDFRAGISGDPWLVRTARMAGQVMLRPHWSLDVGLFGRPLTLGNMAGAVEAGAPLHRMMAWMQSNLESSLTWSDVEWFRSHWNGPIVVKGVLDVEDAREAVATGIDGIVVSNHGGRQLDGVRSTARVLNDIAQAVKTNVEVLVDGGVRSGLDVVKMLASGATGVLLGRAWAFALGARGEDGVRRLLATIANEMRVAMALTGCRSIDQINDSCLDGPA